MFFIFYHFLAAAHYSAFPQIFALCPILNYSHIIQSSSILPYLFNNFHSSSILLYLYAR